jgi:inosose dehydratase
VRHQALVAQPRVTAFDPSPVAPSSSIRVGYAAITWGGNDLQAIDDISALGFRGIQLRSNVLERFGERPEALRDLLAQRQLKLVALSSGAVRIDAESDDQVIAEHARHAEFVRDVGGLYLQVTDERPRNRLPSVADYARLGKLLTEIGERTAAVGIPLGYHNHISGLGERPDEVRRILDAADPRYVKLLLDIAHFRQADGDPAQAIREYRDRLLFLHIKDVARVTAGREGTEQPYHFVELGNGLVDLPAVFRALSDVHFDGWVVIELDSVTDKNRTPMQSAAMNRKYVEEQLGISIR